MATRALIGTIETDAAGNQVLTSTYNHYDGYPENLGVALNAYYDTPSKAKEISDMGYISYINPETGEIDAKHNQPAGNDVLPDNFEEAMYEIYTIADSMGADYVYLYDFDAEVWLDCRNKSQAMVNKFRESGVDSQFDSYPFDDLGGDGDNALGLEESNYERKWQAFLNEGKEDVVGVAQSILRDKPDLDVYIKSLANSVRLNGAEDYYGYTSDDWEEDYDFFMQDKMEF
jgi:hypothetical protein